MTGTRTRISDHLSARRVRSLCAVLGFTAVIGTSVRTVGLA
jgi:hypothetical protein